MRKQFLLAATAFAAIGLASAADATVTFSNVGDSGNVTFDSTVAGGSANLVLTLTAEDEANAVYTFSYTLTNTSNTSLNPTIRVSSFGFNDNQSGDPSGTASGDFDEIDTNGANYPDGIGTINICLFDGPAGNCTGNGGGATVGDPATGTFTLDYTGSLTSLTLADFVVRYQSTGLNGDGSGTGQENGVPEPSTWAMMLLGFGAIGMTIRRRRKKELTAQFA